VDGSQSSVQKHGRKDNLHFWGDFARHWGRGCRSDRLEVSGSRKPLGPVSAPTSCAKGGLGSTTAGNRSKKSERTRCASTAKTPWSWPGAATDSDFLEEFLQRKGGPCRKNIRVLTAISVHTSRCGGRWEGHVTERRGVFGAKGRVSTDVHFRPESSRTGKGAEKVPKGALGGSPPTAQLGSRHNFSCQKKAGESGNEGASTIGSLPPQQFCS